MKESKLLINNKVNLIGTVVSDSKTFDSTTKFIMKTVDNVDDKTIRAYIPISQFNANLKPKRGDKVQVEGVIRTASRRDRDGQYTNYWNVLATAINKQPADVTEPIKQEVSQEVDPVLVMAIAKIIKIIKASK